MWVSRRSFVGTAAASVAGARFARAARTIEVPSYLQDHRDLFAKDPRAAAAQWFAEARFGLFVHYGLVSLLPGGKRDPAPPGTSSAELGKRFTAAKFDADAIVAMAQNAQMRYVCFTPYHGGGPYNFRSTVAHPNTFDDLPARRDLVAEMAAACRKRSMGLFLYVHASISQSYPAVASRNLAIFREWCGQYGPIAGFWFDTDSAYYKSKDRYPKLAETYGVIRSMQPQALISFCHGVTGDEDYLTYEHRFHRQSEFKFVPPEVQKKLADKPVEIATTLQLDHKGGRGTKMWFNVDDAYHRGADDVWALLADARRDRCNLLLNTGPRGDGSIHPTDAKTLGELGDRIRRSGFPQPAAVEVGNIGKDDR